jgi:fatty acid desaturase
LDETLKTVRHQTSVETAMLLVLFIVLLVLAFGGGGWGRSRYGGWSFSPFLVILAVGVVLFYTGHLSFHG